MNEEWIVKDEQQSNNTVEETQWLEEQDATTYTTYAEKHKDKHLDVPIPNWPLYLSIPLILAYVHFRKRR